jgi:hypothetical protein
MSEREEEYNQKVKGSVETRYLNLSLEREHYLDRARLNSELTIPSLVPPKGSNYSTVLPTPYQSVGARGVNNLSSKELLVLFPPNESFFLYEISESVLRELNKEQENSGTSVTKADIEIILNSLERDILKDINQSNVRVSLFEGLKHLNVAGNVMLFLPNDSSNIKLFRLDRYVVQRDADGNILEIIIKEDLSHYNLPKTIKEECLVDDVNNDDINEIIPLYTRIEFEEESDKYSVVQECNGIKIESSKGYYPKDKLPYIPLRGIVVDGENYGRSYVEEYYGDLKSLEGLYKALVEASASSAKMLFLVNPNGTTKKEVISKAANNAVITGNAADVTLLQVNKAADLSVASNTIAKIEERLGYAFMLNTSVQRNGDRVTAKEISYVSKELEDGLGGIISTLTQEIMIPLLNSILNRLTKQKKVPTLPKGLVKPVLNVGLSSLGRNDDLNRLQTYVQLLMQLQAQSYLNMDEVVKRIGNSLNIDSKDLIKTKEQLKQEQEQAQAMAMAQQALPSAINQMGGIAKEQISQGQGVQ